MRTKAGELMHEQLKKLKTLYDELLRSQKQLDAAKVWVLWNGYLQPNYPTLTIFQQQVLNKQNQIDNIIFDLANKYGDEFMIDLEKIMFSEIQSKDVGA